MAGKAYETRDPKQFACGEVPTLDRRAFGFQKQI
jgi:hypothetical protein